MKSSRIPPAKRKIEAALRAVVRNKGAPGVDGITVQIDLCPGHRSGATRQDGVIDLSKKSAREVAMVKSGTAPVTVQQK